MASRATRDKRKQNLIQSNLAREYAFVDANGVKRSPSSLLVSTLTPPSFSLVKKSMQSTFEKTGRDSKDYDGKGRIIVRIKKKQYEINTALANYIASGHKRLPEDFELVVFYRAKSGYQMKTIGIGILGHTGTVWLADDFALSSKGMISRVKIDCIATPQDFAKDCCLAIRKAQGFKYHGLATAIDRSVPDNDWRNYSFDVECNGVVASVRADYAFAIAKRQWDGGEDAYGYPVLGTVISGNKRKQFKFAYNFDAGKQSLSTIDHVIPQSAGGKTCVANLQIMSLKHNQSKGCNKIPVFDRERENVIGSMRIMTTFARGFVVHWRNFDAKTRRKIFSLIKEDIAYSVSRIIQ